MNISEKHKKWLTKKAAFNCVLLSLAIMMIALLFGIAQLVITTELSIISRALYFFIVWGVLSIIIWVFGFINPDVTKVVFRMLGFEEQGQKQEQNESMTVGKANLERTKRTMDSFPEQAQLCGLSLNTMWQMKDKLMNTIITKWGRKELPPHQQYVAIYFVRNIMHLRGAYLLACRSLCEPSRDLLRTVMETLMRGYLFIVNRKEANLMYAKVEGTITPENRDFLRKRKFWPFRFLLGELYTKETRKSLRRVVERLSRSSHPSIMSAFVDLDYSEEGVKDCLDFILALSYHNIQMMAEPFLGFFDKDFKNAIKLSLKRIADFQKEIVILEPDKKAYSKKMKLKRGNFLEILK